MSEYVLTTAADMQEAGLSGASRQEVDDLVKALGTGSQGDAYGNGAYNDMSALRPQSLETTLKVVTASSDHIKLWKQIGKKTAVNTVEEYNILDRFGGDASPFFVEGGLPNEQDSSYVRKSAMVKFLGTTRAVTHPATLVRTAGVGDIVGREAQNGVEWLLIQIERALFYGDSSLNTLAWDGILPQMKDFLGAPYFKGSTNGTPTGQSAEQFIDMRNGSLSEAAFEDGANIIFENFGKAKVFHTAPAVRKDLSKILFPNQRVLMPGQVDQIGTGELNTYSSNAGNIRLEPNLFLRPLGGYKTTADNGAPLAPTVPASNITAAADSTSKFSSNDGGVYGNATWDSTGTYYYFISAKNSVGESTTVAAGNIAVASGQAVSIVFNRVVSAPAAQSYRIYRGKKADGSDAYYMDEFADAGSGTTQTYVDRNFKLPGTYDGFMLDTDPEKGMTFKQLAPLMKLPLARISAAERFMILLYGMPIVYNPRTNVYYFNIGVTGGMVQRNLFDANFRPSNGTIQPVTGNNIN